MLVAGDRSADATRTLFDVYMGARFVAGPFIALFLFGSATAARETGAFPSWLAMAGRAVAVPLFLAPFALWGADALQVSAALAFSAQSLWILLLSLWLALGGEVPFATLVRRSAFLMLVLAAGLVGIALLAVPDASETFFSWGLDPEPLAAFAGGVYVASAAVYAIALRAPWEQVRVLVVGAVVLSVSVFAITLVHLEVFDFARLQAWAWVVLFAGFSLITAGLLLVASPREPDSGGARLAPWARATLAAVAVLLGVLAVALWTDPTGLTDASPFALPPMGGRFAGSWIAMLAVMAGWAALADRRDEAWLPALALAALPAGALIAGLRTIDHLEPAASYLLALALLSAVGVALAAVTRPARPAHS